MLQKVSLKYLPQILAHCPKMFLRALSPTPEMCLDQFISHSSLCLSFNWFLLHYFSLRLLFAQLASLFCFLFLFAKSNSAYIISHFDKLKKLLCKELNKSTFWNLTHKLLHIFPPRLPMSHHDPNGSPKDILDIMQRFKNFLL